MVVAPHRIARMGFRWLPLLLWMAAIFIASSQTRAEIPAFGAWDLVVKKTSHFLAYALLALLAWRVTQTAPRPYLTAFLITLVYAISDEWHQSFVPTRHGNPWDVLIDALGGFTTLLLLFRRQQRPSPPSP